MKKVIVISGPTCVGKTKYAIEIARRYNGEIVSCDSMQLYKFMNIGSAKPTAAEQAQVRHHLVDEIDPREEFSVAIYQKMAKAAIAKLFAEGKTPIIEGGTGLYLNSLLYKMDFSAADKDAQLRESLEKEAAEFGPLFLHKKLETLDPVSASRIHPNNVKKVIRALEGALSGSTIQDFSKLDNKTDDFEPIMLSLNRNREELYERIGLRVDQMMAEGLLEEVRGLVAMGLTYDSISMKGIGYKEIISHLNGEISLEDAVELIKKNTRHYAKRQITWFKRYEDMRWFNISDYADETQVFEDIFKYIDSKLED